MRMFAKAAQSQAKTDALRRSNSTSTRSSRRGGRTPSGQQGHDRHGQDRPRHQPAVIHPDYFKRALDIAKMPNAPDGLARTLIDWGESQQNKDEKIRSDPGVKQDFIDRMFDTTSRRPRSN